MTHEALAPAINRLTNACNDLAQPRRHTIHTPTTRRRIHLPPRYTQLQQAITTTRKGTHTTEFESKTPVSLTALKLLHEIDTTTTKIHPPPGKWPGWTIHRLHAIPQQKWRPQDTTLINQHAATLENYTQKIDNLFDPPSIIQLPQPCPNCANTTIWKTIDGEQVRQTALQLTPEQCRCQHCGTTWTNDQYEFLGRLLNTQETA
jgi:hypothetical protein